MNFENLHFKKDYDFIFYAVFVGFLVFLLFRFLYPNTLVDFLLAFMVYFFLRISRFVWNLAMKLLGGVVIGKRSRS